MWLIYQLWYELTTRKYLISDSYIKAAINCNQATNYNPTAIQLQSDCNPTAIQLQSNCNLTAINCNPTVIQLQFNCNPTAIQVQSNCNPTAINCNLTAINCNQALWVHFAYRFLNNKSFHLNSFRFACYAEEKIQYYSICTSIRPSSLVNRLNLVKIRWQGHYNQKYDSCSSDKWTFRATQV